MNKQDNIPEQEVIHPNQIMIPLNVSRETTKPRCRLTVFVNPNTIKRIETLETIYNERPGRIIDRLVMTLWNGKAQKLQHCITGRACQFNLPFPDSDIL